MDGNILDSKGTGSSQGSQQQKQDKKEPVYIASTCRDSSAESVYLPN
jgi:hypothetical protein